MIVARELTKRLGRIGRPARDPPEMIFAGSLAAVVRQGDAWSDTIGVVLMLGDCAATLGMGAVLLNRRDA